MVAQIGRYAAMSLLISAVLARLTTVTEAQATLGSAPSDTLDCEVAIIGGGPGGIYSAYRILESNSSINVCLYEATHRVGGRIYSIRGMGPRNDLVLDMGGYRYMPFTQPLITDIIQSLLGIPNREYQPGVPDYKIILDHQGNNAGFATFVEQLLERAVDLGLQMNYNTEVTRLFETPSGGFTIMSRDGRNTSAQRVILNLPSRPLHRLLQNSLLPSSEYNEQLYGTYEIRATKLYLYYENAWWVANGLNNGSLSYNLPWNTSLPQVPIVGRYFDAQVRCPLASNATNGSVAAASVGSAGYADYYYANANSLDTAHCYGYLQATYTNDGGTTNISHFPLDYLVDYASPTPGANGFSLPYSVWDNTTFQGDRLLRDSHTQLMAFHASQGINFPASVQSTLPTQAVVAFWDPSVTWAGGAWHFNKTVNASYPEFVEEVLKPFDDLELYVTNEAFGTQLGWAEGSLVMAENLLLDYFGLTQPSWMRDLTATGIRFGPSYAQFQNVAQMSVPAGRTA